MTLLASFLKGTNIVGDQINNYFVTAEAANLEGSIQALQDTISLFQDEMRDPSLQKTQVQLTTLTCAALDEKLAQDNSLSITTPQDYVADGVITQGKFLRVLATDQDAGSVILCKVTYVNNEGLLILAPVVTPAEMG